MDQEQKTTPLHSWHRNANANMADFGGYDMPLWYETGVKEEHLAVLNSVGIFDTSHMACITIDGDGAFTLLNHCFTRNLQSLAQGRCVYGAFLNHQGHCIDDAIVYKLSDTRFMACVNSGMGAKLASHLKGHGADLEVVVKDLTGKVAKVDIQGMNSARVLAQVINTPEAVFTHMPYFSFKGHFNPEDSGSSMVTLRDSTPILLSRSGYTGEFGFELFIDPSAVESLWTTILDSGQPYGLKSCGLGARDSLRAGACLPLSHQDIGSWPFINHPWEFALPWTRDQKGFTKDFMGASALDGINLSSFTYPFAGDSLKKVPAGKDTQVFEKSGKTDAKAIGHVLTCATDMGIGRFNHKIFSVNSPERHQDLRIKGLSCGFVMVSKPLVPGAIVELRHGKRCIDVQVVTDIRPDRTARKKLALFI